MKKRGKLLIIGLIILISLIILCITFSIFRGIYCTKLSSGPESKILKELEEKFEVDEILGETESDIHCTGDGEPSILFSGQTNYIICMIKNYGEENESYKFNLINFVIRDKRGNYIEKDGILEISERLVILRMFQEIQQECSNFMLLISRKR